MRTITAPSPVWAVLVWTLWLTLSAAAQTATPVDSAAVIDSTGLSPAIDSSPDTGVSSLATVSHDTAAVAVDSQGLFHYAPPRADMHRIEIRARTVGYVDVTRIVVEKPGRSNYFATIILERATAPTDAQVDTLPWTVTGYIVNSFNNAPVTGDSAQLFFDGELIQVSPQGHFSIRCTRQGDHAIVCRVPKFREKQFTVRLEPHDKEPVTLVELTPAESKTERHVITVKASKVSLHSAANGQQTRLTRNDMMTTAATMNDPFRALQTLPGIVAESDISARSSIRGGDLAENRVVLDGISLIEPPRVSGTQAYLYVCRTWLPSES